MNNSTFYLKYRPQKLSELDLTSVRESLTKIVSSGKVPHAFLFSGPKGTGKTSAARIIAKVVNCESTSPKLRGPKKIEPCGKCEQCQSITKGSNLDVIELDAASHRGIDDVRALRDAVKLAPAKARKKVYIIDEAHMLTLEASNALLKTLEEPPGHVLFILATTNPEKLIETIRSRAVSISFPRASKEELVSSLIKIAKGEKIKIDKDALEAIAARSDGSFRDAAKILEQLLSEKSSLKKEAIEEFLVKARSFDRDEFIALLVEKNTRMLIEKIEAFVKAGVDVENVIDTLLERFRIALLAEVGVGDEKLEGLSKDDLTLIIRLLGRARGELRDAVIEQLPLELAVIEWGERGEGEQKDLESEGEKEAASPKAEIKKTVAKVSEVTEEVWRSILARVKPINTSIEALLRAARPVDFDGRTLTLGVYYRFHKERLEEGPHRRVLEDVVTSVLGAPVRVICRLSEPPRKRVIEEKKEETVLTEGEDEDIIKIAEEIFGN